VTTPRSGLEIEGRTSRPDGGEKGALVLVVDDEPDTLELLARRIEAAGYAVATAADGMEALNKARSLRPALMILDLMLPKMDGYKVCSFLKFDERFKSMPIVLLTARANAEDRTKAAEVKADQFLTKPCDLRELIAIVDRLARARGG
jgi:DNA-binding response OmpR family regulator